MKVIIPMAGYGTRLRPLTYSRPKPLVNIAGQPMLKHVIDSLQGLEVDEYIFIIGYLGDQIEQYIKENFTFKATFIEQKEMIGQAHAIYLAKDHLNGPVVVLFSDTLFEANVGAIARCDSDGIIYVKEVEDPRQFGVVKLTGDGYISQFIEKPSTPVSKLAVIGLYYVKEAERLIRAIETQMERNQMTKGEFFIADALQIMIDEGARLTTENVEVWLDCGRPETVLDTNRYLLENGSANGVDFVAEGVTVIPPVYIHPDTRIENAIIGPNATISAGCKISYSIIRDSIVDSGATVAMTILNHSLIGRDARVIGRYRELNVGDSSSLIE